MSEKVAKFKPLIIQFPPEPEEELLKKFQGKVTGATLDAVRRMKTKRRSVAIPAHLVRQLWRETGGWAEDFSPMAMRPPPVSVNYIESVRAEKFGDLLVVLMEEKYNQQVKVFLLYRGAIAEVSYTYWTSQAKKDWHGAWQAGSVPRWNATQFKEFFSVARPVSAEEVVRLGFEVNK